MMLKSTRVATLIQKMRSKDAKIDQGSDPNANRLSKVAKIDQGSNPNPKMWSKDAKIDQGSDPNPKRQPKDTKIDQGSNPDPKMWSKDAKIDYLHAGSFFLMPACDLIQGKKSRDGAHRVVATSE